MNEGSIILNAPRIKEISLYEDQYLWVSVLKFNSPVLKNSNENGFLNGRLCIRKEK